MDTEVTTNMVITYELSHPQLSHPLEIDSDPRRSERALKAWATMYILRNFDEVVDMDNWEVRRIN